MKFYSYFILLFCLSSTLFAQDLILLHTNDHHGHFMTTNKGEFGLAAQATLVNQIREEAKRTGAYVILLSGGDVNTGPIESNFFKALPDIEAMNAIGYDAMVIGNHEFDNPLSQLREQEKAAKFKFLSANIIDEGGKAAFTPYVIKDVGDKKIAIVGFTTPDTPNITPAPNSAGLKFHDPAKYSDLVKSLKRENDMVIALSHLGYFPDESHGINAPGDETLAKRIPEIDVIVGGHTHTELSKPVVIGNTHIVQAKESGHYLGRMDISLNEGRPVIKSYQLIPVTGIAEDPQVKRILSPYLEEANKRFNTVVGRMDDGFAGDRAHIVADEKPVGNFLVEAQKKATNADIALMNGRGIRTGINGGEVRIKDLYKVSPFDNTLVTAELNGAEVWKFVDRATANFMVPGDRPYYSKNLQIEVEGPKVTNIMLEGKPVQNLPEGKYKVVVNNFISDNVTDFEFFKKHPTYKDSGTTIVQSAQSYLKDIEIVEAKNFAHHSIKKSSCVQKALKTLINK